MCANQFWAHKNHLTLFRSLALALPSAPDIHLVCTGLLSDYRSSDHLEHLLREASQLHIMGNLSILGFIPREDQLALLKGSNGIVQPSLAEGWSTVVEDARCFCRPLILSDIPVHKEQEPEALFFPQEEPEALAQCLLQLWFTSYTNSPSIEILKSEAQNRSAKMGHNLHDIFTSSFRIS
jgi:glycosyltransferase involved in cell wall biosynthesis